MSEYPGPAQSTRHAREETAAYIAALARNLGALACAQGLDTLGFLLEMTRIEADSLTRRPDPSEQ